MAENGQFGSKIVKMKQGNDNVINEQSVYFFSLANLKIVMQSLNNGRRCVSLSRSVN